MSNATNNSAREKGGKTQELFDRVTAQIIQHLEEGVPTWVRPWKVSGKNGIGIVPANAETGRPYSGANILILWLAAEANGYCSNGWLTYQQANRLGARIRKGERSTAIIYVKYAEKDVRDDSGHVERRKVPMTRAYSVFNVAQCENLPAQYEVPTMDLPRDEAYADFRQRIEAATGHTRETPRIFFKGNKAAYLPNRDIIVMPPFSAFISGDEFYGTLAHEVIHFTGPEGRLGRKFGKRFGDEDYAAEELVAELGSAFLCAFHGLPATFRSAQYIDHWIKVLKSDSRALFTAASYASQAVGWVMKQSDEADEQLEAAE